MQTSYKATGVLAVCAAGAGVTTMLADGGFFTGMLQHGFLAATVGGLADWFAVTAIFRKPLGVISYRTEILRRNRPRIMQALTDFISDDLLSKEHIMKTLRKQDFAEMLAAYLTERGGRDRIWALVREFAVRAAESIDGKALVQPLEPFVRKELSSFDTRSFLTEGMKAFQNEALQGRIAASVVPLLREVLVDPSVQQDILRHIRVMRERYEAGSNSRAAMFEMANLTDEKLLEQVNIHINDWLGELAHGDGPAYTSILGMVRRLVSSLTERDDLFALADKKFREKTDSLDFISRAGEKADILLRENLSVVLEAVREYMDAWIERFIHEQPLRDKVNQWLLTRIEQGLERKHDLIPRMIEEQLAKLSDDELVEMAESRVADDLQMIRINGSLVGACVGMALYVLVQAVEGVCG